jgi:hypothetical protein
MPAECSNRLESRTGFRIFFYSDFDIRDKSGGVGPCLFLALRSNSVVQKNREIASPPPWSEFDFIIENCTHGNMAREMAQRAANAKAQEQAQLQSLKDSRGILKTSTFAHCFDACLHETIATYLRVVPRGFDGLSTQCHSTACSAQDFIQKLPT